MKLAVKPIPGKIPQERANDEYQGNSCKSPYLLNLRIKALFFSSHNTLIFESF